MKKYTLFFAWIITLVATLASLYAGEVLKWEPCSLCWYQRICLFPMAIILGMATYRRDFSVSIYLIPQTIIGLLFAIYQYIYPYILPFVSAPKLCTLDVDCSYNYFEFFGFITLPLLSVICFVLILYFLIKSYKNKDINI